MGFKGFMGFFRAWLRAWLKVMGVLGIIAAAGALLVGALALLALRFGEPAVFFALLALFVLTWTALLALLIMDAP